MPTAFATAPPERLIDVEGFGMGHLAPLVNKYIAKAERAQVKKAPAHVVEYYLKAAASVNKLFLS